MVASKRPGKTEEEGDPKPGDAILKRMLQTKPKPHEEMVKERRKDTRPSRTPSRASSRQRSKES